jgi:alpha-tubulin suppressor-like RCC1 family protein
MARMIWGVASDGGARAAVRLGCREVGPRFDGGASPTATEDDYSGGTNVDAGVDTAGQRTKVAVLGRTAAGWTLPSRLASLLTVVIACLLTGTASQAEAAVTVRSVAAGYRHTCALISTGHIDCWGSNGDGYVGAGQLGNGTTTSTDTPVEVVGVTNATQVSAGYGHTCAVLSTGHIDCWGENGDGQLGNGTTTSTDTPVEAGGVTNAIQVDASSTHTCALLSTGHIDCWGQGIYGQLGDGTTTSTDTPVEVSGVTNATQVSATCALLSTGHIDCWGDNYFGQLGNGTTTSTDTPVEVDGVTNATQVAAGNSHTCALLSTGHIDCWGYNYSGQLGNGTTTNTDMPVEVDGVTSATQVATGSAYTCTLLSTGHIECWGGSAAQLGNGAIRSTDTPVEVSGLTSAAEVTAGDLHTCALLSTGHVDCWGENEYGQLGNGVTTNNDTPVEVIGVTNATQVAAGNYHTCALLSTGHIECWGENDLGQLGNGTTTQSDTPIEVIGVTNATQVAGGYRHTCAVLSTGHVECWGGNFRGQLGNGTTTNTDAPVEVDGVTNATQVAAGSSHTCALLASGHIACWGNNYFGQLGNGMTTEIDGAPVEVSGITNATQITAGDYHTCALLANGHTDCWGYNEFGQLGNGTTTNTDTPVEVSGITNATQVAAGSSYTCALLSTDHIECWGENGGGELGNGTTTNTDTPVEVSGITNATQVATGGGQTCALLSTGHLDCWGNDSHGQLGNGTTSNGYTPSIDTAVEVIGITNGTQVNAGALHTCALLSTSHVQCWGGGGGGELGDGGTLPTEVIDIPVKTPEVLTRGAFNVTGSSAMTSATINPQGVNVTSCAFEYGPTSSYGTTAPCSSLPGSGTSPVEVFAPMSGLTANTTYHYRIVATNAHGTSEGEDATFTTLPPPPTVTGVRPDAGLEAGGTVVTITGTELSGTTAVKFGSTEASHVVVASPTEITATAPTEAAGAVDVKVTTLGGESATGAGDVFTYVAPSRAPAITKLSVKKGPAAGGTSVTITGTSFAGVTAVKFGSTDAASYEVNSTTSITAFSPAGTTGKVEVIVTTPNGESGITSKDHFEFEAPSVTSVSPSSGSTLGGAPVTVTGSGFALGSGTTTFEFGKGIATAVSCASTTECTMLSPAAAKTGRMDVRAKAGGKTSLKNALGDQYTYD